MAKKNSTKTATKEARQASQPRLLTYNQWGGINFDLSPNTWTPNWEHPRTAYEHERQTDLQPNFLHIQNNIELNDNGSLEVRRVGYLEGDTSIEDGQDLWLYPPEGLEFTQCVYYKDNRVYAGFEDGTIRWCDLDTDEREWTNIDISEWIGWDGDVWDPDGEALTDTVYRKFHKKITPAKRLEEIENLRVPQRRWEQITSYIVDGTEYLIALGEPWYDTEGIEPPPVPGLGYGAYYCGTIFVCPMDDRVVTNNNINITQHWWEYHDPEINWDSDSHESGSGDQYMLAYNYWGGFINSPPIEKKIIYDPLDKSFDQLHTTELESLDHHWYTNMTAKEETNPQLSCDGHVWCKEHYPTEQYNYSTHQWENIQNPVHLFTNDPNEAADQVTFYAAIGNKFGQSQLIPVCATYVTRPPVAWTQPTQYYDKTHDTMLEHHDAWYVSFDVKIPLGLFNEYIPDAHGWAYENYWPYGDVEYINIYVVQTESTDPVFCCQHFFEPIDYYGWGTSANQYYSNIIVRNIRWYGGMQDTDEWSLVNLEPNKSGDDTRGSLATWCSIVDGRIYYWGIVDKPYHLDIGGRGGWELSCSRSLGGGYVEAEPDYGNEITNVLKWKTTSGASIVTVLCHNNNTNLHKRFNLIETQITVNTANVEQAWMLEEIANVTGGLSRWGSGVWHDGLYVLGRYGLMATTHTMEYNSQLESAKVSQNIDPLFTELPAESWMYASMIGIDNVLYWAFGKPGGIDEELDKIIFCYDMDSKAYWTYTIPCDQQILRLFPIDYVGRQEGIGIICADAIRIIPTTMEGRWGADEILPPGVRPPHAMFQTGELASTTPPTGTLYVAQLEFHFDYIQGGPVHIDVDGVDYYGRATHVHKIIDVTDPRGYHDYTCYVRVDYYLENYHITVTSDAWWRLTHIIAKVYQTPAKIGIIYGYDAHSGYYDANGHRGRTHSYIKSYNDLRRAIVT